jgi:tripartite-type tricarboxylate transporter receptor subunit TctC
MTVQDQKPRRHLIKQATFTALALLISQLSLSALAQQKILKIVVPLTPGTTPVLIARANGPFLGQKLDINFTVDNRVGASSMIGMSYVAKTIDPNTLMIVPATTVTLPLLYKSVDFDVIKSFTPITQVTSISFVVVVGPNIPVRNLNDFVNWTRSTKDFSQKFNS